MCYYISITPKITDIEQRFGAKFMQPESYHQVYSASAFTYPQMPVIRNSSPLSIEFFQWGLIPFWVKDNWNALKIRQRTLNARSETIFQKPAFRHPIRSNHCLIIADGFFEWRHENNKKYAYYIKLNDHVPFAIAGIWDSWENPETNESIKTFSVITTKANSLLEKIHNTRKRMPVILQRETEKLWLEEDLNEHMIQSMFSPYNVNNMEAYTVTNVISKLGYNIGEAEVLNEHIYPGLSDIRMGD
jgi:putative SOS response-associated peptidase YedK